MAFSLCSIYNAPLLVFFSSIPQVLLKTLSKLNLLPHSLFPSPDTLQQKEVGQKLISLDMLFKMTRNLPIVARRVWRMIRVLFFMLQKGISKRKLLVDLNTMLKRGNEIATKAIGDLMFHHHHHDVPCSVPPHEYEFSCSNTPTFNLRFHVNKRRSHHHKNSSFFACAFHTPQTHDDDVATMSALELALEMLNSKDATVETATASPVLPGFGKSPMVRKLRITDSPFPLTDVDDDDGFVDKKAEEFIERFYKELSLQTRMSF